MDISGADFTNGTLADANDVMTKFNDVETALTASIAKDGQTTPTAALPMGAFNHTNVGVATARTHYARASQIADGALTYGGVAGGTADAITLTLSPAITAYVKGMSIDFVSGASANTGAVTANANTVGAGAVTWPDGTALVAGDIPANAACRLIVQATTPVFHLQTATRAPGALPNDSVSNAELANMAQDTFKGRVAASTGDPEDLTQAQALSILKAFITPGHRLSLTTAVAVTTADVTGASAATVYWTPDKHNLTPIYNGTAWICAAVSEKSFALSATYHTAGSNYDVWLDYNAGTPRIGTGAAWTNDTTQADVVSRDATYGYRVNNGSVTFRFGTGAGDTVSKSAGTLLWLGTIRAAANGQAEDSLAKRFCWNVYNRRPRAMRVSEATASWNYTTATYRQANGAAGNQLDAVFGLAEDEIEVNVHVTSVNSSLSITRYVGIGLDSTTANSAQFFTNEAEGQNAGNRTAETAVYKGFAAVGRHYYAWLELSSAVGTATWYSGGTSGIFGTVWA